MKKENKFSRYVVPAILILIGVCCIIWGATDGEAGAVFKKAAAICMECIGLG